MSKADKITVRVRPVTANWNVSMACVSGFLHALFLACVVSVVSFLAVYGICMLVSFIANCLVRPRSGEGKAQTLQVHTSWMIDHFIVTTAKFEQFSKKNIQ